MAETIQDLLDSEEFDEDGWVRLVSARWEGARLECELQIDEGLGGKTLARWQVVCDEVRDYLMSDVNGGGLSILGVEDPVVRQHSEARVELSFRGAPADPILLIGRLWLAHRKMADEMIPFDRYLNHELSLDELLASGSGVLAHGPRFLLDAYATELRTHNVEASVSAARPARYFRDGLWHEQQKPLFAMHFGDSFIVAEAFSSRRLGEEAG
jgi:hypothetical protein